MRENLVAFARAVRDGRPYEISGEDLVNNIALLEAIIRSAASGEVVAVGRRTVGQRRTLVAVLGRARHINSEEIVERYRYIYASDCSMFDKCAASKIANLAPEIRLRMNSCASIGVAASNSPAMSSVGALIFESKAR